MKLVYKTEISEQPYTASDEADALHKAVSMIGKAYREIEAGHNVEITIKSEED